MDTQSYRFTLGDFECLALYDGNFNYPLDVFFANAAREELEDSLRQHGLPLDRIATPYTCLLVDTGRHRVLVDTGAGNLAAGAGQMFPSVDHSTTTTGKLLPSLQSAGFEPGDIDIVVITHAHPDHVGGTLDEAGNLVFANARYFLAKDEWAFWTSDAATAKAAPPLVNIARRNLEPLQGRLTFVEDGFEVAPGIQVVATPGHTPGHLALYIRSAGLQLLNISDVVLHPLHLQHPTWFPVFDISPEQAAASKQRTFDHAAKTQALVFAHHFPPFPNLGYIHKQEKGWQWQPAHESGD